MAASTKAQNDNVDANPIKSIVSCEEYENNRIPPFVNAKNGSVRNKSVEINKISFVWRLIK